MKYYPHIIEMDRTQKCSTLPNKLPLNFISDFKEEKNSSADSEVFVQVCNMSADLHWTVAGMGDWFYWCTMGERDIASGTARSGQWKQFSLAVMYLLPYRHPPREV